MIVLGIHRSLPAVLRTKQRRAFRPASSVTLRMTTNSPSGAATEIAIR
jgi:hypothetical protein